VSLALAISPTVMARATIAHHSKSFALASRLLGSRVRDQTAIVYTWCRRADDAVDEGDAVEDVLLRLHSELGAAYRGEACDPVLAAFGRVARAREIPIEYPCELLAGMAMDVHGTTYHTVDDVIGYAWRVAGVVGLMMTHVFGCADEVAMVHAAQLGIAMQLTNICRDVAEDWQRGRLYLPDDLLAPHGAANLAAELGRPLPVAAHAAIAATTRDLLGLADRYYRASARGIPLLPRRAALAVRAARDIYAAIGGRIARADYAVTAGRAVVSTSTKLALVAGAVTRTLFHRPRRYRIPTRTLELADVSL